MTDHAGCGSAGREPAGVSHTVSRHSGSLVRTTVIAAYGVLVLSVMVLMGWLIGVDVLAGLSPSLEPMLVTTALSLALLAVSCLVLKSGSLGSRVLAGGLAVVSAVITVLGRVPGVEPSLERMMARFPVGQLRVSQSDRIAMTAVVPLLLLCAAALLLTVRPTRGGAGRSVGRAVVVSQILSVSAAGAAVFTVISQLYSQPDDGGPGEFAVPALQSALALATLGFVVFVARPEIGLAAVVSGPALGAVLGRRVILAGVVVPFVLGWLRLVGQYRGWYGTTTGTALLVSVNAALFAGIGFIGARAAARLEIARARTKQVAAEHARTQVLIDNIPAAIFMKGIDGRYQLVNRAFEQMTGFDRHQLIGATADDIYPPDTAQQSRVNDQTAMAGGAPVQTEETVTRDGHTHTYLHVRFPLTDSGRRYALCGVATDITDRTRLAAEHEQLQQQRHRTERLETLGQLAGGVAHEFNNLLGGVLGRVELLRDTAPGDDLSPDLDAIARAAERGESLTRQLLVFGKNQPSRVQAIDINPLIRTVTDTAKTSLPPAIHVVTRLTAEPVYTSIDPVRLEQVITNLIDNCRAAMPDGGRLTIETAHLPGNPRTDEQFGRVQLTVTDTGHGMPADVADRAFEPFFTTRHADGGIGLGLATVYGVVTHAGGDVTISSSPETGTTVRITLPCAVAISDRSPTGDLLSGEGRTVLVVDDQDDLRDIIRRHLTKQGYRTLTAASATEALHLWRQAGTRIDVLLTDLVMPGMSGHELADLIRVDQPEIPVLYMSGYTADTLPTGRELPPRTHLLHKPFNRATLLTHLQQALKADSSTPGGRQQDPLDADAIEVERI